MLPLISVVATISTVMVSRTYLFCDCVMYGDAQKKRGHDLWGEVVLHALVVYHPPAHVESVSMEMGHGIRILSTPTHTHTYRSPVTSWWRCESRHESRCAAGHTRLWIMCWMLVLPSSTSTVWNFSTVSAQACEINMQRKRGRETEESMGNQRGRQKKTERKRQKRREKESYVPIPV